MEHIDYNSVAALKHFLASEGLNMSKRLGQNFLVSPRVRGKLCSALEIGAGRTLWEIGPGIGAMTELCLAEAGSLTVFELDYGFVRVLRKLYGEHPNCSIVPGDFLETGIRLLEEGRVPDRLLGNLPYSSGSAMIFRIVETGRLPEISVFTMQREVARRMAAAPGTKAYSLFSIVSQFAFTAENFGDVAPGSFYPSPEVVSRIVRLKPHRRFENLKNRPLFFTTAKALFQARRKTIKNNLFASPLAARIPRESIMEACGKAGIDPGKRGEQLSVAEITALSEALASELPPAGTGG